MSYEEWLEIINELNRTNVNIKLLEKINTIDINSNFNNMLVPKLEEVILTKFEKAVNRIKNELGNAFSDENYLDYVLVNFKKEMQYLLELIKIKQIPSDRKVMLTYKVIEGTNATYDALIKEANQIDPTGVFSMMIKNDRVKWSEQK